MTEFKVVRKIEVTPGAANRLREVQSELTDACKREIEARNQSDAAFLEITGPLGVYQFPKVLDALNEVHVFEAI